MKSSNHKIQKFARHMRQHPTRAEEVLWNKLRNRTLGGFKFSRQMPIGNFIVDFVCRDLKLILEVDGATHSNENEVDLDKFRSAWLAGQGYRVHRVWNNEIYENLDGVLETILLLLRSPHPPLRVTLSPQTGRGATNSNQFALLPCGEKVAHRAG